MSLRLCSFLKLLCPVRQYSQLRLQLSSIKTTSFAKRSCLIRVSMSRVGIASTSQIAHRSQPFRDERILPALQTRLALAVFLQIGARAHGGVAQRFGARPSRDRVRPGGA